ncbi:hypothetical protein NZL82_01485 [Sphingomonas sanguinis]|uniref:hypothetical protein n=1 Tax=Sphingomonas sp. LC-1 TaxID=3110957 RepID=UPI0021BAB1CF|nr:hypothetical protein [Sphingomonas sp. LC-1]MCT8000543.1 hypothetical protein [Sphingomonas sp. LC-1]
MTDKMNAQAELDVTMLTRRARIEQTRGGSVERLLGSTDQDVLALMPLDARTPDEVEGSIYASIASGEVSARMGMHRMDAACVVHTDYAWHWIVHAECAEYGMTPARIAMAEVMDLVRHDWRDVLPERDALDTAVA